MSRVSEGRSGQHSARSVPLEPHVLTSAASEHLRCRLKVPLCGFAATRTSTSLSPQIRSVDPAFCAIWSTTPVASHVKAWLRLAVAEVPRTRLELMSKDGPDPSSGRFSSSPVATLAREGSLVSRYRVAPVVVVITFVVGSLLLVGSGMASAQSGAHSGDSEFTMTGVVCTSRSSCLAVGDFADSTGASRPLSELWNGTSWQVVTIRGPRYSGLNALSCPAPTNCIAVGFSRYGTLAEAWNGTAWTKSVSPGPVGSIDTNLSSISCAAVNNCVAAGYYLNAASTWLTLIESWDGSTWSIVASPNPTGVAGSGSVCPVLARTHAWPSVSRSTAPATPIPWPKSGW